MNLIHRISLAVKRTGYEVRKTDARRRAKLFRHNHIDLVLDVGAATGQYAVELRNHGYNGRLISYEPLDDAYSELARRVRGDDNWSAVHTAVGSRTETALLNVAGLRDSSSILPMHGRHEEAAPQARYVGTQSVSVRRLDDAALREVESAQNSLLKIDTQGYEREVLDGAPQIMRLLRGIQIEMSLVPLYEGAMEFDETVHRLFREGFQLHMIEPGFRDPATQQLLQADGIFIRPDR